MNRVAGLPDLQGVYDHSEGAVPLIELSSAVGPFNLRDAATPLGSGLFRVEDNSGDAVLEAGVSETSIGNENRRTAVITDDPTGRGGIQMWPDGLTQTTTPLTSAIEWTSTIASNIAGGGGLGNDSFGSFVSVTGTLQLLDDGNLFNTGLLFNFGMDLELSARSGPLYTLVNQPNIYSVTAGNKTVSQHNALRCQTQWGPNTAGTLTQTDCTYILFFATVDATGGATSVTTLNNMRLLAPTLTGGGTIGTWRGMLIDNISGPTLIRGIESQMNNGSFILHTGSAPTQLGGALQLGLGVTFDWQIQRAAANRADIASGDSLRLVNGSLQFVGTGGQLSSSVNGEIQFDVTRLGFNVAPAGANWAFAFSAVARTITVGGDFANCLNTAGGSHTINAALSTFTQWTVNAPAGTIGTGSVTDAANMLIQTAPGIGTNRYGMLITSNPSGGTLNYAFRQSNASARARFDGRLDINRGIALGGGAPATLGTVGGSGPTAAAQAQWLEIDINGVAHWIPVWT